MLRERRELLLVELGGHVPEHDLAVERTGREQPAAGRELGRVHGTGVRAQLRLLEEHAAVVVVVVALGQRLECIRRLVVR